MELNKNNMKKILLIVAFAILLLVGLQNLPAVFQFLWSIFTLLSPFILGLCIAFILNVPLRFVEQTLFGTTRAATGIKAKLKRPVSLLLTILLVTGILFIIMFLIIPEIGRTFQAMAAHIPAFLSNVQTWATDLFSQHPEWLEWLNTVEIDWNKTGETIMEFLKNGTTSFLNSTVSVATSVISGVVNFFLGLVFAFYVLMQKEKLGRQTRKIFYAYLPEKRADKLFSIASLAHRTFSNFLSGQCLEACILGLLFFITLTILRFPYALMISVLTAFTALIPVFGAIIGWLVGAFCILIVNPIQALWFLIIFQIIQQIEGNLIYPHVVGNSVNLPSMWVLVAVTIGGSTMGVAGMLLFIPLCSVLYALFRELVTKRLQLQNIPKEKLEPTITKQV